MTLFALGRGVVSGTLALVLGVGIALAGAARGAEDELAVLIERVVAYVMAVHRDAASLVGEERYEQRVTKQSLRVDDRVGSGRLAPDVTVDRRVLLSDYLLVHLPPAETWQPFRDVHTVNGRPVREREGRLERLFMTPGPVDPLKQAEAIRFESSRHNIGDVTRDINVPTYVIALLHDSLRSRFTFRLRGRDRIRGAPTRVIEFEETARPTLIRAEGDTDSPAAGRLWVDPERGTIVRTRLETSSRGLQSRIEVEFGPASPFTFWVPVEMTELHTLPGEKVEGKATYARFRQFRVDTSETIGPPR